MRWPTIKLEALAAEAPYSLVGGPFGSKLTSRDYIDDGVPVIRGNNLAKGKFLSLNGFAYVSDAKMRQDLSSNLAAPGDVVFTQRGTLGQVSIIPEESPFEKYVISQSQMKMTVDEDKACKEYLYYYFTSPEAVQRIINYTSSSGVPHINLTILRNFEVPVPPVWTQRAIASILSSYDDLIENNRRRMQLLEQTARLLYQEWFVRLRFPGHEHVKIKDGVPEGWERKAVPDIIDINPKESVSNNSDIRYVPMSSLSEAGMTVDMSDTEIRDKATSVKFRNGDTLFARITPCLENGKTGFVNFLGENEVASGSTEFIVLRGRTVSSFFVYCLARTHDFRGNAIKSMIGSSGRQRVQTSCFNDFILGLPPNRFLLQFDDAASSGFTQISNLMRQNEQLRKARDLLLPRLMNGEIAV
jgi:type I restriction enzyme, S subunit